MSATIFEILETRFSESFEYYGIRDIIDGEIMSSAEVPEFTQRLIFEFYHELEYPTLVVEKKPAFVVGEVKVSLLTSIIEGDAYFTTVQFNGTEAFKIRSERQNAFIAWLKSGIEQFSIDETQVNEK